MNTPGFARLVYGIRKIKADRAGNRIPPDTQTYAFLELQPIPVVESITHVEKNGGGPVIQEPVFELGAGGDDVVRPDIVIAEVFEAIAPDALAATCFETVQTGQLGDGNFQFTLIHRQIDINGVGIAIPCLCP